ncbi:MAG: cysteine desulfurase [Prevotella sp.]|nr:cysteine desulfurase [Prevotella sp.]
MTAIAQKTRHSALKTNLSSALKTNLSSALNTNLNSALKTRLSNLLNTNLSSALNINLSAAPSHLISFIFHFSSFISHLSSLISHLSLYPISDLRSDFPILSREVYGRPLVYLDNAATTQKPLCVLDAMREEYLNVNANVHRGVHYLSQQATDLHEAARERVRSFINARSTTEIVFTRGTTEAINLVAQTFCESQMQAGDEVLVTDMEHHSNIVPWQLQVQKRGIVVRHLPITDDGLLPDSDTIATYLSDRTRLVSIAHVSNVLGTVNPVADIVRIAHEHDIPVLVDGAQSAPHFAIDVQQLDCDFFAFSGHKMYGPTGIGVLYGKEEWLDRLPPYQGGGEMIDRVSWEHTTFERPPLKFEAGTPDYVATHGLATAIDYISHVGLDNIAAHEQELTRYCLEQLQTIPHIRIFGPSSSLSRDAVVSFLVGDIHHLDMGTLLDRLGIAVRTGHHCAHPLMERLGVTGTVRASFALYNTKEEVDVLVEGIRRVSQMF